MITGVHMIMYSREAERLRELLARILDSRTVAAGGGWPIFALPPAELGVHPGDGKGYQEMYLMCDDIAVTMNRLTAKGVEFDGEPMEREWGIVAAMKLPGEDRLWLYQPKHATALAG